MVSYLAEGLPQTECTQKLLWAELKKNKTTQIQAGEDKNCIIVQITANKFMSYSEQS